MNIYEKVKRARKHYLTDPARIKRMLEKEINSSPDAPVLWASLIFNGDIEYMTLVEKRAMRTAGNHGICFFKITDRGIIGP